MSTNFSKIKNGDYFADIDGNKFRKTSDQTYDDMFGFERYIDPLFDRKIAGEGTPPKPKPEPEEPEWITDPQSRVIGRNPKYVPPPKKATPEEKQSESDQ